MQDLIERVETLEKNVDSLVVFFDRLLKVVETHDKRLHTLEKPKVTSLKSEGMTFSKKVSKDPGDREN